MEFSVSLVQLDDRVKCVQVEYEPEGGSPTATDADAPGEKFVLMAEGLFAVKVESLCDAPMLVRLEVGGVAGRTYHRLPPQQTIFVRSVQLESGMHPTMLEYRRPQNPTNVKEPATNADGDMTMRTVDVSANVAASGYPSYVALLEDTMSVRVLFYRKKSAVGGAWLPASGSPAAVMGLRCGGASRLAHHFDIAVPENELLTEAHRRERAVEEAAAAQAAAEEEERRVLRMEPWRRRPSTTNRRKSSASGPTTHHRMLRSATASDVDDGPVMERPRPRDQQHNERHQHQHQQPQQHRQHREEASAIHTADSDAELEHRVEDRTRDVSPEAVRAVRTRTCPQCTNIFVAERMKLLAETSKWKREAEEWRHKFTQAQQALHRERAAAKRREETARQSPKRRSVSPGHVPNAGRAQSPFAPSDNAIAQARARQLCPLPKEARAKTPRKVTPVSAAARPAGVVDRRRGATPGQKSSQAPAPAVGTARPRTTGIMGTTHAVRTSSTAPRSNKFDVRPDAEMAASLSQDSKRWDVPDHASGGDVVMSADEARALLRLADHGRDAIIRQTEGETSGEPSARTSPSRRNVWPEAGAGQSQQQQQQTHRQPSPVPAANEQRFLGEGEDDLFPTEEDMALLRRATGGGDTAGAADAPANPWDQQSRPARTEPIAAKPGPSRRVVSSLLALGDDDDDDGMPQVGSVWPQSQDAATARSEKLRGVAVVDYFTATAGDEEGAMGDADYPPVLSPLGDRRRDQQHEKQQRDRR